MQHRINAMTLAALAAAAALGSAPALAQNNKGGGGSSAGVITIDQARAEAGGVTAGDAPGFPVTLSQPGSYRLMGNLTVGDPAVHAIHITADHVTLDLNGFVIAGPVTCSGAQPAAIACSPSNAEGAGVNASAHRHVAIQGGSISGFGWGAIVGALGQVRQMRISQANYSAIFAGEEALIEDNTLYMARQKGIHHGGVARGNTIQMVGTGIFNVLGALNEGNRITRASQGIVAMEYGISAAVGNSIYGVTTPLLRVFQLGPNHCSTGLC